MFNKFLNIKKITEPSIVDEHILAIDTNIIFDDYNRDIERHIENAMRELDEYYPMTRLNNGLAHFSALRFAREISQITNDPEYKDMLTQEQLIKYKNAINAEFDKIYQTKKAIMDK